MNYVFVLHFLSYVNFLCVVCRKEMLFSSSIVTSPPAVVRLSNIVYYGVFAERKLVRLIATIVVQRFYCHLLFRKIDNKTTNDLV